MESEVFLLGHWKNFDELEENLSMGELMATLKAIRGKEDRERKFLAAIQGVDLDAEVEEEKTSQDVTALMNPSTASKEGFGLGEGLGFMKMGGVE